MSKKHREPRPRAETIATLLMPLYEEKLEENLGNRLRELRRQHGLSLRALAEKSGLSANTLSLIENGKTSPSVATLQQIALALNVPITAFFEVEAHHEPVIYTRANNRKQSPFAYGGIEELGTGIGKEGLQPFIVTIEPHSNSGEQPISYEGTQFSYCLSGKARYTILGEEYTLEPGDTILFSARIPHMWANDEDEPVRLIAVVAVGEQGERPPAPFRYHA